MALSRAEKYLIDGLKICAVPKGMSAAIFMTLQTDEQMWEMANTWRSTATRRRRNF